MTTRPADPNHAQRMRTYKTALLAAAVAAFAYLYVKTSESNRTLQRRLADAEQDLAVQEVIADLAAPAEAVLLDTRDLLRVLAVRQEHLRRLGVTSYVPYWKLVAIARGQPGPPARVTVTAEPNLNLDQTCELWQRRRARQACLRLAAEMEARTGLGAYLLDRPGEYARAGSLAEHLTWAVDPKLRAAARRILLAAGDRPEYIKADAHDWPDTPADQADPPACAVPNDRTDARGDGLPPGAIARLGTVRLAHGGMVSKLAFSPDGKTLASQGGGTIPFACWDAATGRRLATPKAFPPDCLPRTTAAAGNVQVATDDDAGRIRVSVRHGDRRWAYTIGCRGVLTCRALSPDGRTLAFAPPTKRPPSTCGIPSPPRSASSAPPPSTPARSSPSPPSPAETSSSPAGRTRPSASGTPTPGRSPAS